MQAWLTYMFWPNPENATYTSPKAMALLIACALFVVASFAIKKWRSRLSNPVTKRLSKSWSTASLWFGLVGLVLVVARAEKISYVSMRFWWVVWLAALVLYVVVQLRLFRMRHYEVLPSERVDDPRRKYLPKKKK